MKYLLVLVVVVVVLWLMLRGRESSVSTPRRRRHGRATEAQAMVVCAHCGVHLPRPEALTDTQGRAYCSDAHRLAGPR